MLRKVLKSMFEEGFNAFFRTNTKWWQKVLLPPAYFIVVVPVITYLRIRYAREFKVGEMVCIKKKYTLPEDNRCFIVTKEQDWDDGFRGASTFFYIVHNINEMKEEKLLSCILEKV